MFLPTNNHNWPHTHSRILTPKRNGRANCPQNITQTQAELMRLEAVPVMSSITECTTHLHRISKDDSCFSNAFQMAVFRCLANSLTASEWSTAFSPVLYELLMRFFNGFSTSTSEGFFKGTTKRSDIFVLLCFFVVVERRTNENKTNETKIWQMRNCKWVTTVADHTIWMRIILIEFNFLCKVALRTDSTKEKIPTQSKRYNSND